MFKGLHISMGGPDRKIRDEDGKEFVFEDHPHFGPAVIDKRGDPLDKQPGQHASFWRVNRWWADQGKVVGADGFCVWTEPKRAEPTLTHIRGNHYMAEWPKDSND